jgi:hypothetical protein
VDKPPPQRPLLWKQPVLPRKPPLRQKAHQKLALPQKPLLVLKVMKAVKRERSLVPPLKRLPLMRGAKVEKVRRGAG